MVEALGRIPPDHREPQGAAQRGRLLLQPPHHRRADPPSPKRREQDHVHQPEGVPLFVDHQAPRVDPIDLDDVVGGRGMGPGVPGELRPRLVDGHRLRHARLQPGELEPLPMVPDEQRLHEGGVAGAKPAQRQPGRGPLRRLCHPLAHHRGGKMPWRAMQKVTVR